MPIRARGDSFGAFTRDAIDAVDRAVLEGMKEATEGLKQDLRTQVRSVGLGNRVANAWRSKVYPNTESATAGATGFVYSRAPNIISAYDEGVTVTARRGNRFLWLPSKAVPMVAGSGPDVRRRRATPVEVEARFGKFIIRRGKGKGLLAFVERARTKTAKGNLRKVRKGRIASGESGELVLMFTLLPTRSFPKKLDVRGAANRWGDRVGEAIEKRLRGDG